jgi:hypothetical protein
MRRREFITFVGGAVVLPLAADAQQLKTIPRLCFLIRSWHCADEQI